MSCLSASFVSAVGPWQKAGERRPAIASKHTPVCPRTVPISFFKGELLLIIRHHRRRLRNRVSRMALLASLPLPTRFDLPYPALFGNLLQYGCSSDFDAQYASFRCRKECSTTS